MSDNEKWPEWSISYNFDGSRYAMSVIARDADEARRRLAVASQWGVVDGEIIAKIPMYRGFFVPLICWIRNITRNTLKGGPDE